MTPSRLATVMIALSPVLETMWSKERMGTIIWTAGQAMTSLPETQDSTSMKEATAMTGLEEVEVMTMTTTLSEELPGARRLRVSYAASEWLLRSNRRSRLLRRTGEERP